MGAEDEDKWKKVMTAASKELPEVEEQLARLNDKRRRNRDLVIGAIGAVVGFAAMVIGVVLIGDLFRNGEPVWRLEAGILLMALGTVVVTLSCVYLMIRRQRA